MAIVKGAKFYSVYILRCNDDSLYTGVTTDVARRLSEHKSGRGGGYTRAHPGVRIEHVESGHTRGEALRREAAIKKLSRDEKLVLIGKRDKKVVAKKRV